MLDADTACESRGDELAKGCDGICAPSDAKGADANDDDVNCEAAPIDGCVCSDVRVSSGDMRLLSMGGNVELESVCGGAKEFDTD